MKKIYLYSFAACLGLSLMACDGYKEPNPEPQKQPQLPVLQASDVTVENGLSTGTYDLPSLNETGSSILLAKVTCEKLGEGYTFGADAYFSDDDFETSFNVPVTSSKIDAQDVWELYISPSALSNLYHENISWDNDQASLKVRYNLTTEYESGYGTQVAYVGGQDKYYGPYDVTIIPIEGSVTPDEPQQPEEPSEYDFDYLYTPGGMNGWSFDDNMMLFTSDYKTYSGFVYLEGGDGDSDGFKLVSGDSWNGTMNWGVNEDGALESNGANIKVEQTGLYYVSANLVNLTLKVTLIDNIEMIGAFNGWADDGVIYMTSSDDFKTWTGELTIASDDENQWKFRMNNGWDINLGATGDDEPVEVTPGEKFDLSFGGKNFSLPAGTYNVTLDLGSLPYTTVVEAK